MDEDNKQWPALQKLTEAMLFKKSVTLGVANNPALLTGCITRISRDRLDVWRIAVGEEGVFIANLASLEISGI